jgi:hypothetical protein
MLPRRLCTQVLPEPRHPFASHLFIHATESSRAGFGPNSAGRAAGVADRLVERFGNGTSLWQHIQHMPAHVYLRTGRYGDGVAANVVAHASDGEWLNHSLVPYGPGHDLVFLIYCACMDGQSDTAVQYGVVLTALYASAPGTDLPPTFQWRETLLTTP